MKELMKKIVEEFGTPNVELHINFDGKIFIEVFPAKNDKQDEIFNSLAELKERFNFQKNL